MRIDHQSSIDRLAYAQEAKDPFDLDFKVNNLQAKPNEMSPILSFMCTSDCQAKTGDSFCCTFK